MSSRYPPDGAPSAAPVDASGSVENDALHHRVAAALLRRRSLLVLLCLALLLGFAFQGSRGLWSPDEGRYVDGALGMLDSGNWLVPAYSPVEVNLSKPPLTYWTIAASLKVFGRNTWAARVPYALAFVLTVWLLYGMGRRLVPDKPWLPALIYALSLCPFIAANVVSTDGLLALCEAIAMFGFVAYAFDPDDRRMRGFLVLMWAGWGAAFLTKGPPGLLPLLAIIPFMAWRDGWRGAARLFSPLGILLFLLVGLGWYAVLVQRVPWALHYFLHKEVYDRIFTAVQHRNAGPWGWLIVYIPTLILGSLPWWPGLAGHLFRRRLRTETPMNPPSRSASASLLLWLWLLIPLVVFCLARSRLPLYVLPLFVPLSLLMARGFTRRIDLRKTRQCVALAACIIVLLALKGGVAYAVRTPDDNRMIARQLGAVTASGSYAAVVFVEATASQYDIEETTPWGVRLYLNKPVYAVAWGARGASAALCTAMQRAGSALIVIDPSLADAKAVVARTLDVCMQRPASDAGTWNRHPLLLARTQGV